MWLPLLYFEGRSKTKKAGNICYGTPDIEFEQDRSVGLGATLRDRQKIKNYFSCFKDLMKIVGAIFEKIKIFIFFLSHVNYP